MVARVNRMAYQPGGTGSVDIEHLGSTEMESEKFMRKKDPKKMNRGEQ